MKPGQYFEDEAWELVDADAVGNVVVAQNGQIGTLEPGEWIESDPSKVLVRRRRTWSTEGFTWLASSRLMPVMARRWRTRIYVPVSSDPYADFHRICKGLDTAGMWFLGKTNCSGVRRADQSVIWVDASDAPDAARIASDCMSETISADPPPLTLQLGSVGVAHDPAQGASLGQRVCGAVVGAADSQDGWSESRWRLACTAFELKPDAPWRHPDEVDPYALWSTLERACNRRYDSD